MPGAGVGVWVSEAASLWRFVVEVEGDEEVEVEVYLFGDRDWDSLTGNVGAGRGFSKMEKGRMWPSFLWKNDGISMNMMAHLLR